MSSQGRTAIKPPSLELLYYLEAEMSPDRLMVGSPFGAGQRRVVLNIVGGTVYGPHVYGKILTLGGADWATSIEGTTFMRLDARYTIQTDDGYHLYIQAKGVFSAGPGTAFAERSISHPSEPRINLTQGDVEWFSHLTIESGPGPYGWLNGVLAVGVMAMKERKICINAYRLTNFPGIPPVDFLAQM